MPPTFRWLLWSIVAASLFGAQMLRAGELPKIGASDVGDISAGRLEEVPVELPDRRITHLLVSGDGTKLWIGTSDGVAEYDGTTARPPRFETDDQSAALIVNSMVEIKPGEVLLGTINDTIWLWKSGSIRRLHDGDSRDEWSMARLTDGRLVLAHNFSSPAEKAVQAVRQAITSKVVLLPAAVSHLVAVPNGVIGATTSGRVTFFEGPELKAKSSVDLRFTNMQFVNSIVYSGDERVLVASNAGCFTVDAAAKSFSRLSDTACGAVAPASDGAVWAASNGLFLGTADGWQRAIADKDPQSDISALTQDRAGNLWIGTGNGLYRASALSRQPVGLPSKNVRSVTFFKGAVAAALEDGSIWTVSADLRAVEVNIPKDNAHPSNGYGGAAVTFDSSGLLWVLNGAGLFKIQEATAIKLADCPGCATGRTTASLAVTAGDRVFAGFYGLNDLMVFSGGAWKTAATLPGGNASGVSSVIALGNGQVWATGVLGLAQVTDGSARVLGPFEKNTFGKLHLFGALASDRERVVAAGGWGGTIFVSSDGSAADPSVIERKGGTDQPYIIRGLTKHPKLGLLAASETGVYVWAGEAATGSWRSLRDLDSHLGEPATAIVAGEGGQLWVGTTRGLIRFDIPDVDASIRISRVEQGAVIPSRDIHYLLKQEGLARCCTIKFGVEPSVSGLSESYRAPTAGVVMTGLADDTDYVVSAAAVDYFGRTGKISTDNVRIRLPIWESPAKLAAAILTAILVLVLIVSQRGPAGFILRRIAKKRWRLSTNPADLQLSVEDSENTVRFGLSSPSGRSTIGLSIDRDREALIKMQDTDLADIFRPSRRSPQDARDSFRRKLDEVSRRLWDEGLPPEVTFAMQQRSGGSLALHVSDGLLNLLWEASADHRGQSLSSRFSCGRTVQSVRLASKPALQLEDLKVLVFAPVADLTQTKAEIEAVKRRARSWGASVRVLGGSATKSDVLEAICSSHIFHYAGHAQYVHGNPSDSYLPILNDQISAGEIGAALSKNENQLLLAFINGCTSSREAEWKGGEAVFGLASAFLSNSTYFIGAQWPVLDAHASTLADEFYRLLFPRTDALLWRLFRRKALAGMPMAEALRQARDVLEGRGVELQTRQAYVFYGDPTAAITLA